MQCGYPPATIGRRLRSGVWASLHPGVYSSAGSPRSRLADLWAAVLAAGPGAVVTHESAALLHGAEGLRLHPITLTSPHGSHHRITGSTVHQIDDLMPGHVMRRRGLPMSTPARAVVELGATLGVGLLGRVADDLVRLRRTSYGAIGGVMSSVARPGKPGMHTVALMLEARSEGYVPPASELERLLFATLEAGGLPPPARQIPLPGRGHVPGIADGGYVDARIVLEADGRRWHARVEAARIDRERDAQVIRAGWVPLRFVHEQLVDDPAGVCAIVEETRSTRLVLLRLAS